MAVYVTGTTALSFTQQFLRQDPTRYVVGGLLSFYKPASTTPITGYKDGTATLPYPNPYTLASDGRIPQIFFIVSVDDGTGPVGVGYTSIRMRLTDANGVLQFDYDNIPLLGVSVPAGPPTPGPVVDPNGVATYGDLMVRYGIGVRPGFVRANGLTIGPTGSGATEHAHDECQNLFKYLWNNDPLRQILPFPGSDADSDWIDGHKTVKLPDYSGCALVGLDNMSGTPRNILTTVTFPTAGQGPTVLGAKGGLERYALITGEVGSHTHDAFIDDPGHTHLSDAIKFQSSPSPIQQTGGTASLPGATIQSAKTLVRVKSTNAATGISIDDKVSTSPAAQAHQNVQPSKLVTVYIRL